MSCEITESGFERLNICLITSGKNFYRFVIVTPVVINRGMRIITNFLKKLFPYSFLMLRRVCPKRIEYFNMIYRKILSNIENKLKKKSERQEKSQFT